MVTGAAHRSPTRNDGLDAIRAAACLLVVVHHSFIAVGTVPPWFLSLGGSGVGLFYVLSGYLITRQARGELRTYATRRFLRLAPGYWFAVVGLGIVTMTMPPASAFVLGQPIDWTDWHGGFIGVAWTLRVEIMFYVLAPILVRLPTRWWVLLAFVSLVAATAASMTDPRLLAAPPLQLWRFLPGMLLARSTPATSGRLALGGAALVWGGCLLPYVDVATAVGGYLLVAWCLTTTPAATWARLPANLSYATYLWHGELMRAFPLPLALAGTVSAALASWFLVERRFLRWRHGNRANRQHAMEAASAGP